MELPPKIDVGAIGLQDPKSSGLKILSVLLDTIFALFVSDNSSYPPRS